MTSFSAKVAFGGDFGAPKGIQKLSKIYDPVLTFGCGKPSGGHLGYFVDFFSILGAFGAHSGHLLEPFSINFRYFLNSFINFCCVQDSLDFDFSAKNDFFQ